jgi:tripartite-type tricarboxylate transporter receptor subunit TctC
MDRRHFLLSTGALAALPSASWAAGYPSSPLRIVVPNAAGGAADLTARAVGQALSVRLKQPVLIDNRPSAGGIVAGELVARARPDGYTLLLTSSGSAVSEALFKKLPFKTVDDFAQVSQLGRFDLVIAVDDNSPFKTLGDLVAWAKANPGKLNLGAPQIGTTQNLAAELFKLKAGIQGQVVPFNGTPPIISAVRGGELHAMLDILGPLMPQIQGKGLRALAVLGRESAPQLPGVPTVASTGGSLAGFDVTSWNGLAVPAKTPPAIVDQLSQAVQAVVKQPDVIKQLQDINITAQGSTPAQLTEHLKTDIQRWRDVIAAAKLQKL